jgi:tRNA-(ms[2]io[6]A)-hydroxylase
VRAHLDEFLRDHAANERKVSASAMRLAVEHPEHRALVDAMIGVAREELEHFKCVYDVLAGRGQTLGQDAPDPYMRALGKVIRTADARAYLLRRLLGFAIVEARGRERFALLARAFGAGALGELYARLARAEARHQALFLRLARVYYDPAEVDRGLDALLDAEAAIVARLPVRPALH